MAKKETPVEKSIIRERIEKGITQDIKNKIEGGNNSIRTYSDTTPKADKKDNQVGPIPIRNKGTEDTK